MPPRHADLHLRIATDGKDRCVSRQARRAGHEALSVGLSCLCFALGILCTNHRAVCICGLGRSAALQILAIATAIAASIFPVQRLAAPPDPLRTLGQLDSCRGSLGHWALGIGHWRLYIDNGGCPWWGDCSPAVGRGSHRGVQPVGCLSKPCARSPVEGWCGARKGARSEPGENSPFVAPARIQCACRGRSSFGNAPGGAFVIHWIHVSIFFPQQNVRRT